MKRFHHLLPLATLATLLACEQPARPALPAHGEPIGLFLDDFLATVVRADTGSVVGEIEIVQGEGELPHTISVRFFDRHRTTFQPEERSASISWSIADTSVATILPHESDRWRFYVVEKRPGMTSMRLMLRKGERVELATPEIPIRVLPFTQPSGAVVRKGDSTVVTIDAQGAVSGAIEFAAGEITYFEGATPRPAPYKLYFLDREGREIGADGGFFSHWSVRTSDQSVLFVGASTLDGGTRLHAHRPGVATLLVQLHHSRGSLPGTGGVGVSYIVWKTPEIPVAVR